MNFLMRVGAGVAMAALVFGSVWFAPIWFWTVGVAVFAAAGLAELFRLLQHKGVAVYNTFGIGMAVLLAFVVYDAGGATRAGEVLFIVLACFGLFVLQFLR